MRHGAGPADASCSGQFFRDAQTAVDAGDPQNYVAAAVALPKVSTPRANAVSRGFVNFIAGDHGSILSPAASLAATAEIQRQIVTFAASDGATILISSPAVIQP